MKVQYLHICNYKQFSDLELDLTYPQGHKKAGEPLDKICIIGQSGTGKTNLLNIIKKSTIDFSEQSKNSYLPFSEFIGESTDDRYITTRFKTYNKFNVETLFTEDTSEIIFNEKKYSVSENEKNYFVGTDRTNYLIENVSFAEKFMTRTDKSVLVGLEKQRNSITVLGIDYHGGQKEFTKKIHEVDEAIENLKQKYTIKSSIEKLKHSNFLQKLIININDEMDNLWSVMKEKIASYDSGRLKQIELLSDKLLSDENYDKKHYKDDLGKWEKENENILEIIADDINFILNKFNLKLTKIDENQESYRGLLIEDLSNKTIIGYDNLSTGTKNLLSTFIPLKTFTPKNSIILIDEPEMSFYPDIQRQLTDLYMDIGDNNQLILATHSPLIASSFEPWEVVELKFDKNNQVYREKYYEGENHVDNYTVDPRMLTWTGILTDVFDLKEDSNFSFREKKLMEYATLKAEIKAMEDKKTPEATEKIKKFKKLSSLLGLQN